MLKAECRGNKGCLQRDGVEMKSMQKRSEGKEQDGAGDLLEAILDRDNLNSAYKHVKKNKGAVDIDGMTVEEALSWIEEHKFELLQNIRDESYICLFTILLYHLGFFALCGVA